MIATIISILLKLTIKRKKKNNFIVKNSSETINFKCDKINSTVVNFSKNENDEQNISDIINTIKNSNKESTEIKVKKVFINLFIRLGISKIKFIKSQAQTPRRTKYI